MSNEFAEMPAPKYRVRVELYPAEEPDVTLVREDAPLDYAQEAAARIAVRAKTAIVNYEANNQ
jgi:hypothetical protein